MLSKRAKWLSCLLLLLLLTGCWDRREIEERSNALASGLDVCPEEKSDCAVVTSRQIAIPGRIPVGASGGGDVGDPVVVITVSSKDGPESVVKTQQRLNRRLSFGHMRLLLLSEALARKPLGQQLDYTRRLPDVRRREWVAVAEGRAEDIIRAKPPLERVPALFLNDMIDDAVKTGRMPAIFLGEFLTRVSNKGEEAVAPLLRMAGPDQPQLAGLAVFRGERMVGKLSQDETDTFLELRGVRRGSELLRVEPLDGGFADLLIYSRNSRYRCRWVAGRIDVHLSMKLEGEIEQLSAALSGSDPTTLRLIEAAASAEVTRRATALVTKLQTEFKSDVLAVGERVRAGMPAVWQSIDNWPAAFARARFHYDVQVHVRRSGMSTD